MKFRNPQPLLVICLNLLWFNLFIPALADEVSQKYSIESRYAFAMGYRVGQSMRAQGVASIEGASLAEGVNDLLQGRAANFDAVSTDHDARRSAYQTGYQLGQSLKAQGIRKVDVDSLVDGVEDAVAERKPRLSEVEMNDALNSYLAYQKTLSKNDAHGNLARAEEYLAGNAARDGVRVLDSGLQYEVLKSGSGERPQADDAVLVHYQGRFMDDEVFDSSIRRGAPARFELGQVIAGFREALTNMQVGEKWRIHVHPELGYGRNGVKDVIGANELLIFELELLGIEPR